MSNNVSLPRTRSSFTLLERLRKRPPTATPSAPSPQTNGTFYKLPTELLIAIFCCGLDAKDIISLGRTCRLLHSISITNEPWTVVCEALTNDISHHSPPFVPPVLTNPSPLEKRKSSRELKPPAVPKGTPVETAQTYCKRILKIRNALRAPEPGDPFLPSIHASGSPLMRCRSADFITMSMSAEGDALAIALMHEVRIVDLITLRTTTVTLARKKNRGSLPTKPLIQIMVVTLNGRRNAFIETNLL
ncbi:hypothetical protein DL93DRAFT_2166153 [Clavulina sp. PMI_390]|nr:hypothetical protein DL93DRAFT_2166153 [Clavulina sp. PMI_390]